MLHVFDSMQTQWSSLFLRYKNFTSDCQWRSQHISFTINHVLCSSAAAVGSWILWVSLFFFIVSSSSCFLIICHKIFSCFLRRCEVWTVDTASLSDCAARSTSDHHLSGLLFSRLLHSLDQTACRERTGVDWNEIYWRFILQRFT